MHQTYFQLLDADSLDQNMRAKLVVGDGNNVVSAISQSSSNFDLLDNLDEINLVLRGAFLKELLAQIVAVRGKAQGFGPLENDTDEILGDGKGSGLSEASLLLA